MLRALAIALAVLGCSGGGSAPAAETTPTTISRPITPRSKLPTAVLPLLPTHGVYAAGGGLVSSAWRVVLDLDAKTLYGGTASASNAPSFGPMDKESTKDLSPRNEQHLMGLAHAAWNEPPPSTPSDPTADYDEVLIVLEGEDAFFVQGYGPIRRAAAAKAIIELRAAAGL
jgi:hypothetical protein